MMITKQSKLKENASNVNYKNLSARTLWGKIIVYLREHNNIILHIVCGDITDVSIDGDKFIIKTTEQSIIDMLNEADNYKQLKKAFEYFGFHDIEIQKSKKQITDEDNIKILNKYFNNEVIIINKK